MSYVIDIQSGTFFNADHARLVDESKLSERLCGILDNGSDAELVAKPVIRAVIQAVAEELGRSVIADRDALDAIANWLRCVPEDQRPVYLINTLGTTGRSVG